MLVSYVFAQTLLRIISNTEVIFIKLSRKATSLFVLCMSLILFVLSTSKAYAATSGIATLDMDYMNRKWAYAATNSTGLVTVSIDVTVYDGSYHQSRGDSSGSMSGFTYVSFYPEPNKIITAATSWHSDPYSSVVGIWVVDSPYVDFF